MTPALDRFRVLACRVEPRPNQARRCRFIATDRGTPFRAAHTARQAAQPLTCAYVQCSGKMCRWLVWCGSDPIPLEDLIFWPTNSLIHQSFNGGFHPGLEVQNNMKLNADGFGVGWYGRGGAAVFRSTTAAWNNRNLRELSRTIESTCAADSLQSARGRQPAVEEHLHRRRNHHPSFTGASSRTCAPLRRTRSSRSRTATHFGSAGCCSSIMGTSSR